MSKPHDCTIRLFTTDKTWVEGESLRQLEQAAALPGMLEAAGFPDLHPGKCGPVGAAMLSEGVIYPTLAGSDVGCSVALHATGIAAAKARPEKWAKKLHGLEEPWGGDAAAWLEEYGGDGTMPTAGLGTIGRGNHFAELLRVQEVHDQAAFGRLGLDAKEIVQLTHSGSRSVGEALLRSHTDRHNDGGLVAAPDNPELDKYLDGHDRACSWARANRELIVHRMLEQIGGEGRRVCEQVHNSITRRTVNGKACFLHRKGAAASDQGAVMIPGSRGTLSYLVEPVGDQAANLWSVAHGAGRKWARGECEGRLRGRHTAESLQRTRLGSYVICEDRDLLYEEMELAYKPSAQVIEDMVEHGLITVIASFTPLLTYKLRRKH